MNDGDTIDWSKTTFDGSRRARAMIVRQRLEALDELIRLFARMCAMRRETWRGSDKRERFDPDE